MLNDYPVPQISEDARRELVTCVDSIIAIKTNNPQADTTILEERIKQFIYRLYGLTQEEIALIEAAS